MTLSWLKYSVFSIFLGIALAACTSPKPPPAALDSECRLLTQRYQLAEALRAAHIPVIQIGDETTLIVPGDRLFYSASNHLCPDAARDLNKIIAFINAYPVVDVRLTGYTDSEGDYIRNLALSRAQAQAVAHYLWQHGLNARLISAAGRGCHNCIASNATHTGRAQNRRIEIYFRLPAPDNVFH